MPDGGSLEQVLETLHSAMESMRNDMRAVRALMDERDVRYQQRFVASQEALAAALAAAEKAVAAALLAADRAVTKAELASEKRFEAVNEFRGSLADQAGRLLPRTEADQRFSAISDAIARLEKVTATKTGSDLKIESSGRNTTTVVAIVVSTVLGLSAIGVSIVVALTRH